MKATVKYGNVELQDVETMVAYSPVVASEGWPPDLLIDRGPLEGEFAIELTDSGRRWVAKYFGPRTGIWYPTEARMQYIIKKYPRGSYVDFGGRTWRIYRRDYKRNKVHLREVTA